MVHLRFKKNKGNIEVNVFSGRQSKSIYGNLITPDPKRIAQVLLDLSVMGFPIEKAIRIVLKRIKKKDWIGI